MTKMICMFIQHKCILLLLFSKDLLRCLGQGFNFDQDYTILCLHLTLCLQLSN